MDSRQKTLPESSDEETSWAAGLFVGEGCASLMRRKTRVRELEYPVLLLDMLDERSVRRFALIFGLPFKSLSYAWPGSPHTLRYRSQARGARAAAVFARLLPFLAGSEKEVQIRRILRESGWTENANGWVNPMHERRSQSMRGNTLVFGKRWKWSDERRARWNMNRG